MGFEWSEVLTTEKVVEWLLSSGLRIALIAVGAYIATRIANFVAGRAERFFEDDDPTTQSEREKQAATLSKIITNVVRIVAWTIAGLMILKELGVEIGPILAGVGIVGLAVGFGAQSLVKDFLSGMFILIENQFNVGDVVKTAGVAGLVEKISLRATTLRDLEGNVHIVPNGEITVVTNMTKLWSRALLDIGVAYKEDVDHVMQVLKDVAKGLEEDPEYSSMINSPLEILGVEDFADSAVVIRAMFTTQPLRQWTIKREFRRRIKNAFDEQGIEIPFPHRTVYLGEGPPMDARMKVEMVGSAEKEEAADHPRVETTRHDQPGEELD